MQSCLQIKKRLQESQGLPLHLSHEKHEVVVCVRVCADIRWHSLVRPCSLWQSPGRRWWLAPSSLFSWNPCWPSRPPSKQETRRDVNTSSSDRWMMGREEGWEAQNKQWAGGKEAGHFGYSSTQKHWFLAAFDPTAFKIKALIKIGTEKTPCISQITKQTLVGSKYRFNFTAICGIADEPRSCGISNVQ